MLPHVAGGANTGGALVAIGKSAALAALATAITAAERIAGIPNLSIAGPQSTKGFLGHKAAQPTATMTLLRICDKERRSICAVWHWRNKIAGRFKRTQSQQVERAAPAPRQQRARHPELRD